MLANARATTRARSGQSAADLAPADYSSAADRLFGYLAITRAGVSERHVRSCARCRPGAEMGAIYGPCRAGMWLARRADEALAALEGEPVAGPAAVPPAGTLW
jgi:hypothetical protein